MMVEIYRWTGWALLVVGLLVAAGCKQPELPDNRDAQPDFYLLGQAEQQAVDIAAGEAGFYMETGFQATDEVRIAFGALTPLDCADCPDRVEIYIRDHKKRLNGSEVNIDSLFFEGEYGFYNQNGIPGKQATRVSFTPDGEVPNGGTYHWDFGDGSISNLPNPVHDYTDSSLISPTVCFEAMDPTGCETIICNEVWLTEEGCEVDFTHFRYPGSSYVEFDAVSTGERPFTYRWDFGDGYGATLGNPGYFYAQPGLYTVCLTVTDGAGCERTICKNIAADPEYCEHNFTYQVEKTTLIDQDQLSGITVVWYDESGKAYRSDLEDQPDQSFFRVLSRSHYQPNEAGNPTVRLAVALSARLYAEDGSTVDFSVEEGRFGMAYWE